MKTIDEDIKSGQFKKIYLLYGDEAYLKKQYKDKLKKALVQPDDTMNFTAYEGKDTNPKEVIDLSETLPFFADRRVILIENSGFFKGSCEELAEYMPQVPDTTLFLFVEEEVDKRSKLYKAVKNVGKIVEFTTQTEELLTRWILTRLKKEGKNITGSVMQLFLSKTGTDMGNIDRELEKLICYCMDKDVIEAKDVEAVTTEQTTNKIFDMVNAIAEHNQKKALELSMKTDMGEHMFPPTSVSEENQDRYSEIMSQVKTLADEMEASFICGTTPMSEWDSYQQKLKDAGIEEAVQMMQEAYDTYMAN